MHDIKIVINRDKCCYCGACVAICPVPEGAIDLDEVLLRIDQNLCIECGNCIKICPVGALSFKVYENRISSY